ncbi:putative serine/threonine-protein kinase receptor [Hordeum vulgare]|nr:putative serine/threonine-protein kinase receptor [Hordeum vulgare]
MGTSSCIPIFILLLFSPLCKSDDRLTQAKPLFLDDTLISKGGAFALGFYSPTSSNASWYLCIWYHNISKHTVVWTANRDSPITAPSSPMLAITNNSDLVLSDSQGHIHWAVNNDITGMGVVAELLNKGNFVLRRSPNNTTIWESFDHPTDTLLPTAKILFSTGRLVSWKELNDPSTGNFSLSFYSSSTLQFIIWNGTQPYSRILMPNDGSVFGDTYPNIVFSEAIGGTGDGLYYQYTIISDNSPYVRVMLDYMGVLRTLSWNNLSWTNISVRATSDCDLYASCGPFGYCDYVGHVPTCRCLDGFEPVGLGLNFSGGCRRTMALTCGKQSYYLNLTQMKIPDKFLHVPNKSIDDCAAECSNNCLCTAYTMTNQSRCLIWLGELIDTGKYDQYGENLHLRLADSPDEDVDFPFVSFEDIAAATDNFSDSNQIGRGGFGKVYKDDAVMQGILEGVNEVAIKRLSKDSGQGIEEFKNEVVLIAKLQHKNLVRLLGCCIHGDERLLIYEYLPNKSLDTFLFDAARQFVLDWPTRFKIIKGVARGLLYLHQDSRLTIIHRDLKASNILLDSEMVPKISDFGMARIFGGNQQQANTTRVVGTYGYMSPEYVMGGAFSVKSDTYSFGVLLLEIAWRLWEDGKAAELVHSSVIETYQLHEALRCIHVGLLCVQDRPDDRPLMSSVIFMLENESALLSAPKKPAYFALRNFETTEPRENIEISVDGVSNTTLVGR